MRMVRLNVKEWLSAKIEDERIRYWLWLVVLVGGLLLIYGHLFYLDPFMSYDDPRVISPMEQVHTWSDYWTRVKSAEIVDLQPVRDLLTWIDYFILSHFKYSVFHLTNVLIWIGCILSFRKLLVVISEKQSKWIDLFTLQVAFSPLYVISIAWLSSRKHLLAAFFILLATIQFFEFLKGKRRRLVSLTLFYALATFSQPIVVAWPLWVLFVLALKGMRRAGDYLVFLPLMAIMVACIVLNYQYYNGQQYLIISGGYAKFNSELDSFIVKLFMFGRYFFQMLIPYWVSMTVYSFTSIQNVIGILLLPAAIYLFWKCLGLKNTLIWLGFYGAILAPVIVKMTQIPGSDTYLCTAGFGLAVLFYLLFAKTEKHWLPRWRASLMLGVTSLFFFHSFQKAQLWASEFQVFEDAYFTEGGLHTAMNYVSVLMDAKRYREAVWITEDLYRTIPNQEQVQSVLAFAIVTSNDYSTEKKAELLRQYHFTAPRALGFQGDMEAELGHYAEAEQALISALKHPERRTLLRGAAERLAVELYRRCKLGSKVKCAQKIEMIQGVDILIPWSQSAFEEGLRSVHMLEAYRMDNKK